MTHALHDIFEWMEKHPEDKEKIYNDPIFLQRCVHESMRLHPASPVAWRKPTCPIELDKEIRMNQDDLLIMDLHTANRDKEIFGIDAEEFNPYRKLDPNQSIWGLTFGIGLHLCFGRDLDGGLIPDEKTLPKKHQYGIVTLLVRKLIENKVRLDPDNKPLKDMNTERPNWGSYPVLFGEKK